MAITRHLAELILAEHRVRPIAGNVLLLGRQLVLMTPGEAEQLVEAAGIRRSPTAFIDYDKTAHPYEKRLISDASFFSLFSDAVVCASDVSNYEGAEIIFNLSEHVPDTLKSNFDFIYNGSVLDNVFDPAACIRNISRMLKDDAVIFHYEGAAHASPAYLKFSPDWLFDYYAINDFADFQGYIVTYDDVHLDPWNVFEWEPFVGSAADAPLTMPMTLGPEAMVVAIAQKRRGATIEQTPLQNVYRDGAHDIYRAAHQRFGTSIRREMIRSLFSRMPDVELAPEPRKNWLGRLFSDSAPTAPLAPPSTPDVPGHRRLGKLGSPNFLPD